MSKYWDWKLNENADSILWIQQREDGTIRVTADFGGYWKLPDDTINVIFDMDACQLFNSQLTLTNTKLGLMVLREWQKLGCPTKEVGRDSAYIAAMGWVPEHLHVLDDDNLTEDIGIDPAVLAEFQVEDVL